MRDVKRGERIRKLALEKERVLLSEILKEGISQGFFDSQQCEKFDPVRIMVIQGIDFSYLRDNFIEIGVDESKFLNEIIEFILNALKRN